jgi:competence protein ComEA
MKTIIFPLGAFCCFAVIFYAGSAKAALPDGPGKDVTVRLCSKCHSPEQATSLHQSQDAWERTVGKMVNMGAQGTDAEFDTVVEYLSKHFGPEAPPPINVNTATAVDLESSLELLRSEATAIIDYRSKNGNFKSIEDFRKVPGLRFNKIEAEKSRITF